MKYRRKPSPVDAIKWTGQNFNEINEFVEGKASTFNGCLFIGEIIPDRGEMVIKYSNGKIGKMNESAFLEIYEPECLKENKEI